MTDRREGGREGTSTGREYQSVGESHLGNSEWTPTSAMLASPVSDDIFLFIAAAVASAEAASAAAVTAAEAANVEGGEMAPLATTALAAPVAPPAAAAAAAAGIAGRPLAAAAAGSEAGPWSPPPNGLEFPGIDRVESGFFS